MYTIILSQDTFIHKDALHFPIEERGLQFGDGVYEVIRIYDGRPYLLDEHIARLFRSLDAIHIPFKKTEQALKQDLIKLIAKNKMTQDGFIYLQVTRGNAERVHAFPASVEPNFYAYLKNRKRPLDLLKKGAKTITHPDQRWENCYIKSLNLLPNVLAKQKAVENDAYEAILHRDHVVTEGSSSNIFLVKDGSIYTHPATNRILSGCVRSAVIRLAKNEGIPLVEEAFTLDDINKADEMFLTSSTSEVMPIVQINDRLIQNGKPGKLTQQLQAAYEKDANIDNHTLN